MEPKLKQWFETEIANLLDDLYGAALRLSKNRADAEDLVGEAVANGYKCLHTLQDRHLFRGWMFRILSNCFISECRRRKTRAEISLDGLNDECADGDFWLFERLHQPFLLWWSNPERQFLNDLLHDDLIRAIDGLEENNRLVLVLAEMQGFKYQDIATMLEIPVGTVRSRLSRARSQLQKSLWEHARERGFRTDGPPIPHTENRP